MSDHPTHTVVFDREDHTILAYWPLTDADAVVAAQRMARDTGHVAGWGTYVEGNPFDMFTLPMRSYR